MDLQPVLVDVIHQVCGIPVDLLGADTDLMSLGVDSLAVVEVIVELEMRLGIELPLEVLRRLDEVRTIGGVTTALEAALVVPQIDT